MADTKYCTLDEIKNYLKSTNLTGDKFRDISPDEKFDDILTELEKRTRSVINQQIGGRSLLYESDREDVYQAPSSRNVSLVYPVQEVKKVERYYRNEWDTVDEERYYFTDFNLVLRGRYERKRYRPGAWRAKNPLTRNTESYVWNDLADKVRVTYDRGFEEIPHSVKDIQKTLIKRYLTHMRQDQNLSLQNPEDVQSLFENRSVFTEDLQKRMDKITHPQNTIAMI